MENIEFFFSVQVALVVFSVKFDFFFFRREN